MDIHVERKINIRIEVNRIRHSINILEDYLLIQQNNPQSIEVIRTMENVNDRCNQLREVLGMYFDISVIPDIQEDQVTDITDIGDVRMRINRIRYLTCDIEFCLLDDLPHINNEYDIREIITFVQEISMISLSLITLLITPQPPQQLPPLPPAQGGKKRKKNNKNKNRKITRKKTQKKY